MKTKYKTKAARLRKEKTSLKEVTRDVNNKVTISKRGKRVTITENGKKSFFIDDSQTKTASRKGKTASRVLNARQLLALSKDFEYDKYLSYSIEEMLMDNLSEQGGEDFAESHEIGEVESPLEFLLGDFSDELDKAGSLKFPFTFDTSVDYHSNDEGKEYGVVALNPHKNGLFVTKIPSSAFRSYKTIPEPQGFVSEGKDPAIVYIDTDAGLAYLLLDDKVVYERLSDFVHELAKKYWDEELEDYYSGD